MSNLGKTISRRSIRLTPEDERDTRVEYRGTGFYVGLVAIFLFGLALFILAVQNTQDVEIDFLGFTFSLPLFAVAIGAALIAVVLDELIGLVWRKRRRTRLEERAELDRFRAARVGEAPAEEPEAAEIDRAETPGESIGDQRTELTEDDEQEKEPF